MDLKILSHPEDSSEGNQQQKATTKPAKQQQQQAQGAEPLPRQLKQANKEQQQTSIEQPPCGQETKSRTLSPQQQSAGPLADRAGATAAGTQPNTHRKQRTSVGETLAHGSNASKSRFVLALSFI